jgi:uncharacterized protein
MPIPTIDTHEFTRRGDVADGEEPLAALARLASMLSADRGALGWRLAGRSELGPDGSRSAFLRLAIDGTVRMRCVRCLEPVDVPLRAVRDYRLVATEAQAQREDPDEEDVDLLVSSRRFDLGGLIEDEAIMALPPAPRHDDCRAPGYGVPPAEVAASGVGATRADHARAERNPFARLAALRGQDVPETPATAEAPASATGGARSRPARRGGR